MKSKSKTDVALNDPDYHYRIVSKETSERIAYHKELGYGVAHDSGRALTMGVRRDEHEKRQREALERAGRIREQRLDPQGDVVQDETSIERARAVPNDDE
jgi:hypothetical protein